MSDNLLYLNQILDEKLPKEKSYSELITYVTDRPGHDKRYAINPNRITSELGWCPSKTFEEGLIMTVEWYVAHREWCEKVSKRSGYFGDRIGTIDAN